MSATTTQHIFLDKQHPVVWRALNGLGLKVREAAEAAGIDRRTIELLYVRTSQINGCAYCLDMHVAGCGEGAVKPRSGLLSCRHGAIRRCLRPRSGRPWP